MQMTHNFPDIKTAKPAKTPVAALIAKLFGAVSAYVRGRRDNRKTKQMLYLNDHVLDDIGLSRSDIVDALGAGSPRETAQVLNERRADRCAEIVAPKQRFNALI